MAHELIRTYDRFDDAEAARQALLGSGFRPDAVHLSVSGDEAGPVEGNFVVGNGEPSAGGADAYDSNYADPVHRGIYRLIVDAESEAQDARARAVLDGRGATDPQARADAARRPS